MAHRYVSMYNTYTSYKSMLATDHFFFLDEMRVEEINSRIIDNITETNTN